MRPAFHFRFLVLCIALSCLHLAVASPHTVARRQNDDQTQAQSATGVTSDRPSATISSTVDSSNLESIRPSSTINVSIKSSNVPTASTFNPVSASTTSDVSASTTSNNADANNLLPIKPKLTPAMGISGVLLLVTGLVYAVIGIKNKWIYVFGSAAYLTTLAVTVLIVYLMGPPVSNAIQGAFFVAAFVTGVIFGALSLVFSDITEGFGCLLGGFCLSMWFLSLRAGGLIQSSTGRAIFIGCMSAGGYSLSFSHYTRNYGLIGSIAFSGATATILGIDCLASAGWKEFWLYLWNLNGNIFPLDTNTYPVTKHIKAELAGVVIITVFGVVSQLRVWKLVKEHRTKSAAQQLEQQQDKDREEEALGRKIEDNFHKERAQWEAAYGAKSVQDPSVRTSMTSPKGSTSIREKEVYGNDSLEMVNLTRSGVGRPSNPHTTAGTSVTVSVLNDDDIREIDDEGNPVKPAHRQTDVDQESIQGTSRPSAPPPPPAVVPLPFTVPTEEDAKSEGDNASLSAIPDSDHGMDHERRPMSKRISDMSAMKLGISRNAAMSQEALIGRSQDDDDRASSVAATLDDDEDAMSLCQVSPPHSPLAASHMRSLDPLSAVDESPLQLPTEASTKGRPVSGITIGHAGSRVMSIPEPGQTVQPPSSATRQFLTISTKPKSNEAQKDVARRESRVRADTLINGAKDSSEEQQPNSPPLESSSQVSRTELDQPQVANLRDGILSTHLSKVALSYRTNEWAKHLEAADKPSLDELQEPTSPSVVLEERIPEMPAPVSDEITSPLVGSGSKRASRRASVESRVQRSNSHALLRSTSTFSQESLVDQRSLARSPPLASPAGGDMTRSNSGTRLDVLSPLPSNTLMGQRESLIKNRVSSQSLTPNTSSANLLAEQGEQENMTLAQRRQILQQQTASPVLQHQTSVNSQRRAPPSASQKWQKKGLAGKGAPPGFDSHQPQRSTSTQSNQKREQLYAGWRDNMRDVTPPQTAVHVAEQQRQALMNERRQKELEKQQRELVQQQRASKMDSMMRSGQMLDAHREAMRKMQAAASKRS